MKAWYTRVLRANDPSLRAEVKKAVLEQEGPQELVELVQSCGYRNVLKVREKIEMQEGRP